MSCQSHQAAKYSETVSTESQSKNEDSYYYLFLNHKHILTAFYDYYMEFTPQTVKQIFKFMFMLNKISRILLLYCLFYNTIWWLPNSTSKNLAINYSNIDPVIFFILVYYNFSVQINSFFFRLIFLPFLKCFVPDNYVRFLLDVCEIFFHLLINLFVFFYLKKYFESVRVFLILSPHFFLIICSMFDISIKLCNCELFTNRIGKFNIKF